MEERSTNQLMLLFCVSDSLFACAAEPIIEVVPRVKITPLPHAPSYFCGLINYGGKPVPIIDFSQLIENRPSHNALHSRIILLNPSNGDDERILGIIVEKVTETTMLSPEDFIKSGVRVEQHPYLGGVFSTETESVQFVYTDALFGFVNDLQAPSEVPHG